MNSSTVSVGTQLAANLTEQIENVLLQAARSAKPLELDPQRGELFELFVTAEAAGFLLEDAEHDLSADGICRTLSERWGLRDAAADSFERQSKLSNENLGKMRLLWSLMRMWMEWTYAWNRWREFHESSE